VTSAAAAGMPCALNGTVTPTTATNQTITWAAKDAGTSSTYRAITIRVPGGSNYSYGHWPRGIPQPMAVM
jgi:hypothetical protein